MQNIQKVGIAGLIIVAAITVGLFANQSEVFQGRLSGVTSSTVDYSNLYLYKNHAVTVVTSPVTSVVVSEVTSEVVSDVTSEGGTSQVASQVSSQVASTVTSPVASGVAIRDTKAVDMSKLKKLTAVILKASAKADYIKNPAKYRLSSEQKAKILKLYEEQN